MAQYGHGKKRLAAWLLLAAVFVISLLPTMVMTLTMARRDGARR